MIGFLRAKDRRFHSRVFQHRAKTKRLRAGVRMIVNMQNQERRNTLALRHVRHRRVFAMPFRHVAKLFAMPKLQRRLTMHPAACLLRLDNRRHVIRVAIDGHAANEIGKFDAFGLQVALVGAE